MAIDNNIELITAYEILIFILSKNVNENKNSIPIKHSTIGYIIEILFLQLWHLPNCIIYVMRGIFL